MRSEDEFHTSLNAVQCPILIPLSLSSQMYYCGDYGYMMEESFNYNNWFQLNCDDNCQEEIEQMNYENNNQNQDNQNQDNQNQGEQNGDLNLERSRWVTLKVSGETS